MAQAKLRHLKPNLKLKIDGNNNQECQDNFWTKKIRNSKWKTWKTEVYRKVKKRLREDRKIEDKTRFRRQKNNPKGQEAEEKSIETSQKTRATKGEEQG